MKNKKIISFLLFVVGLFSFVNAQTVVRVDNKKVFLDISSFSQKIKVGDSFKVIVSKEELINPKTKKNLGEIFNYSEEGKIIEVQPLYAIGELPTKDVSVKIGQDAVVEIQGEVAQEAKEVVTKEEKNTPKHKFEIYPAIKQKIISVAEGVFEDEGNKIITLSSDGKITIWNDDKNNFKEVISTKLPKGKTPVTISVANIRKNTGADIFVTGFDSSKSQFVTYIYEVANGKLEQIERIPYFVKTLDCGQSLWGQKINNNMAGNASEIVYKDGKFSLSKNQITTHKNWLTGINFSSKKDISIYALSNGDVQRVEKDGIISSLKDISVVAPNRVKYKQDIFKIYPSLQVVNTNGTISAIVATNTPKIGVLSNTFGQYKNGSIQFVSLDEETLVSDIIELEGVVWDLSCSPDNILATQIFQNDSSKIVKIFK